MHKAFIRAKPPKMAKTRSGEDPHLHTSLKSLYKCCTATDAADASASPCRYFRGIYHRRVGEVEVAARKGVGEPTTSVYSDNEKGRPDPARHTPPVSSTGGRIAQFDERVAEDCRLHGIGIGRTACRGRILAVTSLA